MEEPDTGAPFGSLEEELEYWREQAARNKLRFGSAFPFKPPKRMDVLVQRHFSCSVLDKSVDDPD